MKKLLIGLLVLAAISTASGQDSFSIGPKIGYNSNTLTNNLDSIKAVMNNSFQIGAFMRIGSRFYIQPEVNYQVTKGTISRNSGASVLTQDYRLQTIKIPALIGVKLLKGGVANFRIMAGPALTYVIDKQLDPSIVNDLWPVKSVDDIKNSTWSVQAGAGIDVLFMTLDVRYELGLDNMYDGSSSFKLKTNVFNVSLGVKLL